MGVGFLWLVHRDGRVTAISYDWLGELTSGAEPNYPVERRIAIDRR
jgi:hypothetical protein